MTTKRNGFIPGGISLFHYLQESGMAGTNEDTTSGAGRMILKKR
ncbi:hypothetical protein [Paenibacillus spongiae]|nr:hypothetical protein [Paenibacillus spongiae]